MKQADLVASMLTERHTTHGDFESMAFYIQNLKAVAAEAERTRRRNKLPPLSYATREALDSIFLKVGRVLAGDPAFEDHWNDIAGYAMRMAQVTRDTRAREARLADGVAGAGAGKPDADGQAARDARAKYRAAADSAKKSLDHVAPYAGDIGNSTNVIG